MNETDSQEYAQAILERLSTIEGYLREIKIGTAILAATGVVTAMKYLGLF